MKSEKENLREFEGFSLDLEKNVLWRSGEVVPLPPKAVEMLIVLVKNRGDVVSKAELLEAVWGDTFVEESVLSNNVYLLRKSLEKIGGVKNLIQTVPRRGYRFGGKDENGNNSDVVVEHHVFEQTLIERSTHGASSVAETLPNSAALNGSQRRLGPHSRRPVIFRSIMAAAMCALLLTGGIAAWRWNQADAQSGSPRVRSIAVLPLKPIGANEADKVLSLGLADALISRLGSSRNIIVRPVSSVSQYADIEFDALAVGRELRADAVLDGSFQRVDDRLRVSARLIRVTDGQQIWADTFEQTESDLFRLQDSISRAAATALFLNFNQTERELIFRRYTENPEAYQAYQRGRYLYFRRDEEKDSLQKSFAEFEKAIALDTRYALAYTGLSDAYSRLALDSEDETRREHYERAKSLAKRAIDLDPNLAEAYASLGWINRIYDWDWAASEANLKRAIELAPNVWTNHRFYAYLLITLGRTAEAVEVNQRAKELYPLQGDGWILYCDRRYEDAVAELSERLPITRSADARYDLAFAYLGLGRSAEAVRVLEELSPEDLEGYKIRTALAASYFQAGNVARADELLRELEIKARAKTGRHARLANLYAVMGRNEQALSALESAIEHRDDRLMWIRSNPLFDTLRDQPRFRLILVKMNLPG